MTSLNLLAGHFVKGISRSVRFSSLTKNTSASKRWWAYSVSMIKAQSFSEGIEPSSVSTPQTQINLEQQAQPTFASLFESSKFAQILNPVGKKAQGEVIAVVGENLYVDFGCKFHGVVKKPEKDQGRYIEGAKVVLLVKDLEMSMHPLGSSRDLSLLEAEVELVTD